MWLWLSVEVSFISHRCDLCAQLSITATHRGPRLYVMNPSVAWPAPGSVPGDLGTNLTCSSSRFPLLVHSKKKSAQTPPPPRRKGAVMCLCLTPNGPTPCCPQGSSHPLSASSQQYQVLHLQSNPRSLHPLTPRCVPGGRRCADRSGKEGLRR